MNNRKLKRILSFFCSILLCFPGFSLLSGCEQTVSRTFFTADTVCTITLYRGGDAAVLDGAVALANELSGSLSCKEENSEVGQLNQTGISETPSSDLLALLDTARHYCHLSEGAFDITVKPLSDLWDFKNQIIPDKASLAAALPKVGYKNVSIENNAVCLQNGAEIDLGAIAKGYISDRIVSYLTGQGVTSAIINLGGNVYALGQNGDRDFSVGIQTPFSDTTSATLLVRDAAVVTSGTYQRCFEQDGILYHHLLDTKTGMPVQNSLTSVTIIAPNGTDADALSTLCFLLGKEEGMALIEQTPDTEAVFIDEKNTLHLTTGLSMDASKNIIYK